MDVGKTKAILERQFNLNAQSNVALVGLGVTGLSVACFLQRLGIAFFVIDSRPTPPAQPQLHALSPDIRLLTGAFSLEQFEGATHLLVSPGISLHEPVIGLELSVLRAISDIDLFAVLANAPIVAITGSNGKSTVTTLLGDMASTCAKNVRIGGNLGTPVLDLLDDDADLYVIELSSFQLERTHRLNASSSTVLNLSADHLDRHADLSEYASEKQRIFRGDGVMVINLDDALVCQMRSEHRATLTFSITQPADFHLTTQSDGQIFLTFKDQPLMPLADLPLEGSHNAANALAALALGMSVGLSVDGMCHALRQFKALAHRMERVSDKKGMTWINDSKATNIGACLAALQGFEQPVILIAGGDAKGADVSELAPVILEKAKAVVLIGKDALLIESAINTLPKLIPTYHAQDMREVVNICAHIGKAGDVVLLSPACASLDQYRNYQDRGNQFVQAIKAL